MGMVAFGDWKDFLQFLRMVHLRRRCTMRKNCKNVAEALPLPARDYCPHSLNGPASVTEELFFLLYLLYPIIDRA